MVEDHEEHIAHHWTMVGLCQPTSSLEPLNESDGSVDKAKNGPRQNPSKVAANIACSTSAQPSPAQLSPAQLVSSQPVRPARHFTHIHLKPNVACSAKPGGGSA